MKADFSALKIDLGNRNSNRIRRKLDFYITALRSCCKSKKMGQAQKVGNPIYFSRQKGRHV